MSWLQSSLTGNGARIAVICTITPASSQAEETHNTLKFATRAKKIEIKAQRNKIVDQASLIRRYQEEIHALRTQLDLVARERGGHFSVATHDPLHPEVQTAMFLSLDSAQCAFLSAACLQLRLWTVYSVTLRLLSSGIKA